MQLDQLSSEIANALWRIDHDRPDRPLLIWPTTRDESKRVSEQESKILITQWLQQHGYWYALETPTTNKYQQKGIGQRSARIDVTVYGSKNPRDRILNIELKEGTSILENYRKDFEKLLREGVPGLWFHTLANASDNAWGVIEKRVIEAFERVKDHAHGASHTVHFAFCVLDEPTLVEFDVELSGNWQSELSARFESARQTPTRPDWFVAPIAVRRTAVGGHTDGSHRVGPRRKSLIFAPSLNPRSFIHLNAEGESYCLRTFGGADGVTARKHPDCRTTTELRARHQIEIEVDVASERENLSRETAYWSSRIAELNREHNIG